MLAHLAIDPPNPPLIRELIAGQTSNLTVHSYLTKCSSAARDFGTVPPAYRNIAVTWG
jgi:hypothetical protein